MAEDVEDSRRVELASRRDFVQKAVAVGAVAAAGLAIGSPIISAAGAGGGGSTSDAEPASYIIYTSGGTTYARNGMTGAVDYSGPNSTTVIEYAINTLGAKTLYLKKNVGWTPTNNTIPGGVLVAGEDPGTNVIQASNPSLYYISVGPQTILFNISVLDKWGVDQGLSPNVPRPVGTYKNNRSVNQSPSHWYGQGFLIDSADAGVDRPGIASNNFGVGDAIYAGALGSSVGLRAVVNSIDPANSAIGLYVLHYGRYRGALLQAQPSSGGILLNLNQQSDIPALQIDDTLATTDKLIITSGTIVTGRMVNLYQNNSAFGGSGILMNFGGGTGSFGGFFENCMVNGDARWQLSPSGTPHQKNFANTPIASGATQLTIPLPTAESDINYFVDAMPNWNTTVWVTNQTATNFVAHFGSAAPGAATLSWRTYR